MRVAVKHQGQGVLSIDLAHAVKAMGLSIIANLPMLALLLTPKLMRSRAGSETVAMFGILAYLLLVVLMVIIAPILSAAVESRKDFWTVRSVRDTVGWIRKTHGRAYWKRIGEFFVWHVLAQLAGGIVAWIAPYIWDNPEFGTVPGADRWVIDYSNYALQAVTIYLVTCVGSGWYASRMRSLALETYG